MKKSLSIVSVLTMVLLMLSGCGHTHKFADATCIKPKTCMVCGETEGKPLGHDWQEADCVNPKICKVCGETEGESLGHDWREADCVNPKTCKVCGQTEGTSKGHSVDIGRCSECGELVNEGVAKDISNDITTGASFITSATDTITSVSSNAISAQYLYNEFTQAQNDLNVAKSYFQSAKNLCNAYPNGTENIYEKLTDVIDKIPSNVYGSSYDDLINYANDCADMLRSCQDLYDTMSSFALSMA